MICQFYLLASFGGCCGYVWVTKFDCTSANPAVDRKTNWRSYSLDQLNCDTGVRIASLRKMFGSQRSLPIHWKHTHGRIRESCTQLSWWRIRADGELELQLFQWRIDASTVLYTTLANRRMALVVRLYNRHSSIATLPMRPFRRNFAS